MTTLLEGLFLGLALLILYLVFADRATKEPWSKGELALFGCGLGLALMGAAIEVAF